MYNRWIGCALFIVMSLFLLTSCFSDSRPESNISLKILSMYDRNAIENAGLRAYLANHAGVSIEFIAMNDAASHPIDKYAKLEETFMREQPDIVITDPLSYRILAEQNSLADLQLFIQQSGFPIDEIHPGVREWIVHNGNGLLAGMAPYFQSAALFYNYDLFEQYDIPLVQDHMSWEEIIHIAKQFAGRNSEETPVYGYYGGENRDPLALADQMADTINLSYMNWDKKLVTANTESWRDLYAMAIDAHQFGGVFMNAEQNRADANAPPKGPGELFLEGNIAIMPGSYDVAKMLIQSNTTLKWGIATQPVDPNNRIEGNLSPMYIYSINARSGSSEAAWRLVSELTKASAGQQAGVAAQLPSWSPRDNEAGRIIEPFYKLAYKPRSAVRFWEMPTELAEQIHQIRKEAFSQALEGDISIEEALITTQANLEQLMETVQ